VRARDWQTSKCSTVGLFEITRLIDLNNIFDVKTYDSFAPFSCSPVPSESLLRLGDETLCTMQCIGDPLDLLVLLKQEKEMRQFKSLPGVNDPACPPKS